jgi:D-glycero-D-manno-heptose 1,7-bisphosphate phosphatase
VATKTTGKPADREVSRPAGKSGNKVSAPKRAVFMDRDGTIIRDRGYLKDPNGIEFLPGAVETLKALCREGWKLVVISNQSGVGRGLITLEEMNAVQAKFIRTLRSHGIEITASYLCTHTPEDQCDCRKPMPGALEKAAREYSLDVSQSWMLGDRESDVLCGRNAACPTIWFRNSEFEVSPELPDHVANGWAEVYEKISDA